jgi:hypothetical protein
MVDNTPTAAAGPAIGSLHEVRARFASSAQMHEAIERLAVSGFDRADMSVVDPNPDVAHATPESGAKDPDTEEDARQARTMHTSTAASMAAMAGAGITVATGGAAAPAVAVALAAGAAVGGATFAVSSAANEQEQAERDALAAAGRLVLSVRTPTPEKRAQAEAILRGSGGTEPTAV